MVVFKVSPMLSPYDLEKATGEHSDGSIGRGEFAMLDGVTRARGGTVVGNQGPKATDARIEAKEETERIRAVLAVDPAVGR